MGRCEGRSTNSEERPEIEEEPVRLTEVPPSSEVASERECQRYRELFEKTPVGYLVTDTEGCIQEANQMAAVLMNLPPEELVGQRLARFVSAEERRAFRSALVRMRRQDRVEERSVRICPQDSTPFDAAFIAGTIRDEEGMVAALTWLLRHRVEQQQAEEGFRQNADGFRTLTETAPIGLLQTDEDRRCVYSNSRWRAITGLTQEESQGYGWSRALHPDDREGVLREWSNAAREGRELVCEHRVVTPQGEVRWVQTQLVGTYAEDGSLLGFVGAVDDITERKAAEEALLASERRFRALTERSWDGISMIAADGTILYDNPDASTRILGYPTGALVGQSAFIGLHPEDRHHVTELFHQVVQTPGGNATAEFRYQHKDGSWRWIECIGSNMLGEPSVRAIVTNYRDITERKHAEEEIRRRHRELAALNVITAAVSSSLELPEVLATFKRLVAEELAVPGGMIFFRDPVSDQLTLHESWGLPASMLSDLSPFPMAGSHYERVIRQKKPVLVSDFREVALFFALRMDVARPDWQSYLCVPLLANDEIQGVVGLFTQAPAIFSDDQLAFFEALGREVGVAIQHARLFEQLHTWRQHLETLSHRLVELQEAERRHVAHELHDEVGQLLTGLKLTLEMAQRQPAATEAQKLTEPLALVNELIARVRKLSLDLRPAVLDDLGLLPALLLQFDRYTAQTGVQVTFEHTGLEQRFPSVVETAAYRIVQEALTNVARHAGVKEVTVRIWSETGTLYVQVQDQGVGFDPRTVSRQAVTCGLAGMRDRAVLLGGRLEVESAPGTGTSLTAELPIEKPADQSEGKKR